MNRHEASTVEAMIACISESLKREQNPLHHKLDLIIDTIRATHKNRRAPAVDRDWNEIDRLLGKITDAEIMRRFKIASGTVKRRRDRLGIAPAPIKPRGAWKCRSGPQPKYDFSGIDWSMANSAIAEMVGCSPSLVFAKRKKMESEGVVSADLDADNY